jgi:hypothetical protein
VHRMFALLLTACSVPLTVDPAPPPATLVLSGPAVVRAGEAVSITVSGPAIRPGQPVDIGWGPAMGSGPCPYAAQTGGSPCMDIAGPPQLLGSPLAAGPAGAASATLVFVPPPGEPLMHVQAFHLASPSTSNVLSITVQSPVGALTTRVEDLEGRLEGVDRQAAITSAEVADLAEHTLAASSDLRGLRSLFSGRTLYLPFEDGVDALTYDLSGLGQIGELRPGAALRASERPGLALDLDGTGCVVIEDHPIQRSYHRGLTAMAWIRPGATPTETARLVSKHFTNGSRAWDIHLKPDLSVALLLSDSSPWVWDPATGTGYGNTAITLQGPPQTAPLATWTHVAATWDRATGHMTLYIDGVVTAEGQAPPNMELNNTTVPLIVGAYNANGGLQRQFFTGQMDEVMVYNRALTAAEVEATWRLTR